MKGAAMKGVAMSEQLTVLQAPTAQAAGTDSARNWSGWSDFVGMVASLGCAVHCAAMPFVIAYLPACGLSFLADEAFHKWMAVGCFAIAITAFIPGLRKHGRLTPVIIGGVGLLMISIAAFGLAGDCCKACKSESEAINANSVLKAPPSAENLSASTGCTAECCPHCATAESERSLASPSGDSASPLLAVLAPWLTPLGGLVLVTAHLLNRRYGCLCRCCQ
jgi:hypothetical protein